MKIGDHVKVHGKKIEGLSSSVHTLAITRIRGDILYHCATLDGELDDILVWNFEIIGE
jgi:hypothetical protein